MFHAASMMGTISRIDNKQRSFSPVGERACAKKDGRACIGVEDDGEEISDGRTPQAWNQRRLLVERSELLDRELERGATRMHYKSGILGRSGGA